MTHICLNKTPDKRYSLRRIYGDCLEAVGLIIPNEGYAIIDCGITPEVGDLVHCSRITGQLGGFIKRVERIENDNFVVGTRYVDEAKDFSFEAAEIYGVVKEVYDRVFGNRIYCREQEEKDEN